MTSYFDETVIVRNGQTGKEAITLDDSPSLHQGQERR